MANDKITTQNTDKVQYSNSLDRDKISKQGLAYRDTGDRVNGKMPAIDTEEQIINQDNGEIPNLAQTHTHDTDTHLASQDLYNGELQPERASQYLRKIQECSDNRESKERRHDDVRKAWPFIGSENHVIPESKSRRFIQNYMSHVSLDQLVTKDSSDVTSQPEHACAAQNTGRPELRERRYSHAGYTTVGEDGGHDKDGGLGTDVRASRQAGGRGCGMEFTDINYVLRKIDRELDKPYHEWRRAMEEHGRLKVKSTAEQQEAKRKEREKKLKIYQAATNRIFGKKEKGELDEEFLTLTGEVLSVNPDFYTLWNYRKETFEQMLQTKDKDILQKMLQNELFFLESCLKINPKSYGTWHHRCFVMNIMPDPDWGRELQLCNQFLQYDERNFHCWDYRRFVVKQTDISPEAEFDFTFTKISSNFSNYSSWHYRSKLLPLLYPDTSQPMGVSEHALLKEYELVQNGIFTDPDDQSNWFYHRWLMGRGSQHQAINLCYVLREEKRVIVSFNLPLQMGPTSATVLECNGAELQDAKWHNQSNDDTFSTLWISEDLDLPSSGEFTVRVKVTDGTSDLETSVTLADTDICHVTSDRTNCKNSSRFKSELSAVKTERLQQELESVEQLMELETDNKWVALSVVLLMKALDPVKHCEEIMRHLDTLIALDYKRVNYYLDLKSKLIIENILDADDLTQPGCSLLLKDRKLTKLYHPELLPLVAEIDLAGNSLHEVTHFGYLQSVKSLNLAGNRLSSCAGLGGLPQLETLTLNNNEIASVDCLRCLMDCPRLKTLEISGNPFCSDPDSVDSVKKLLPNVDVICASL